MKNEIRWKISGEGYDESIEILDSGYGIIFSGNADSLITSVNGKIELCLNYGDPKYVFHHELKTSGSQVIFVPTVSKAEMSNFSLLRTLRPHTFSVQDCTALWNQLRYDPSEISELSAMTTDDWLLLWFMRIPSGPNSLSVDDWKKWISEHIVAEEAEGNPSIKNILNAQLRIRGEVSYFDCSIEPVVAYIDDQKLGIIEWNAVDSHDRNFLLIGDNWGIKAEYAATQCKP